MSDWSKERKQTLGDVILVRGDMDLGSPMREGCTAAMYGKLRSQSSRPQKPSPRVPQNTNTAALENYAPISFMSIRCDRWTSYAISSWMF